jgi:activator of HSP90 ATPase
MKTKGIRQSILFKATPHQVYEALMDSKKHARFSRHKSRISRKIGGKFKAYGDYIEGIHLELVADQKIVQSWRGKDWKPGLFSTVRMLFTATRGGTKLSFTQEGIPEQYARNLSQGWREYYWKPMKAMLESS